MPTVLISKMCEGCDDAGLEVCKARRIVAGNCYRGEINTDSNKCLRYDKDPSSGPICKICGIPHIDCCHDVDPIDFADNPYLKPIDGTAKAQEHYKAEVEPIEIMQMYLSPAEMQGYIKGNLIKYLLRMGKKDAIEKEVDKVFQYSQWLRDVIREKKIDPRK